MATLIDSVGTQHYANKMVLAENRRVGSKSLPSALADIDNLIDEMKELFEGEYGSALDMKLENNTNIFHIGTNGEVNKKEECENGFSSIEIFGNSLVNLTNLAPIRKTETGWYTTYTLCGLDRIKYGATYTLIFNHMYHKGNSEAYTNAELGLGEFENSMHILISAGNASLKNGRVMKVFTARTTEGKFTDKDNYLTIRPCRRHSTPVEGESVEYTQKDYILLEGDYSNKPLPTHFQGLKSVGQKESDVNEIEILSRGKNLCSVPEYKAMIREYTTGYQGVDRVVISNIKVDPNKSYKVIADRYAEDSRIGTQITAMKSFSKYAGPDSHNSLYMHCTENSGGNYLHLSIPNIGPGAELIGKRLEFSNIQVIENSCPTDFEEHKQDISKIQLSEPLRGLPNGVKDSIQLINGEWKIVRRCAEWLLDGSSSQTVNKWSQYDSERTTTFYIHAPGLMGSYGAQTFKPTAISSVFPMFPGGITDIVDAEGMYTAPGAAPPYIAFRIYKKRLAENATSETCREYLKKYPIRVVVELLKPIIEDIDVKTLAYWRNGIISIDEALPTLNTHTILLNKPAQIKRNVEELTTLRSRVLTLEEQYDQIALEQAHKLDLLNHSFELDYNI